MTKRLVPLALIIVRTAGFGRKAYDSWRGTSYGTIWRQQYALGFKLFLALPLSRNERDLNDDAVAGSTAEIRRTYPGLLGRSGTDLNDCTFLFVAPAGRVLEIDTIGEVAHDLTVWEHGWIDTEEADREVRLYCTVPPWARHPCPR